MGMAAEAGCLFLHFGRGGSVAASQSFRRALCKRIDWLRPPPARRCCHFRELC